MKKEYFLMLLLIVVVFFVSSCSKFPVMPIDNSANGFLTPYGFLNFKEVSGKDISCIGKPENYVRGFYHSESDDYGFSVSLLYYVKGDDFSNAKKYFLDKIEKCGYEKVSESTSSFGFGNFVIDKFYSVEYEKNSDKEYDDLTLNVIVQNINGEKYTLVNLEQYVEKNSNEGIDNEYNGNDNSNGESSNYQDVVPFGDAEKYDKEFKNILESVVGTLHLISFGEQTDTLTYLKYQSERKLTDDDASNIANAFRSKGYNVNAVSIEDPENTIVIQEPSRMITVTFNPNDDILELSVVKLQ